MIRRNNSTNRVLLFDDDDDSYSSIDDDSVDSEDPQLRNEFTYFHIFADKEILKTRDKMATNKHRIIKSQWDQQN